MSTRGADATAGATTTIVEAKKATPTEYVVLRTEDGITWVTAGGMADGKVMTNKFRATSGEAAIKQWLDGGNDSKATALVAVPARSWQPVKPKTTTVTKTTLEAL